MQLHVFYKIVEMQWQITDNQQQVYVLHFILLLIELVVIATSSKHLGKQMFHFKQFSIAHDKCAMKVGTDGVLLGSWAKAKNAQKVLDIGTGTDSLL